MRAQLRKSAVSLGAELNPKYYVTFMNAFGNILFKICI